MIQEESHRKTCITEHGRWGRVSGYQHDVALNPGEFPSFLPDNNNKEFSVQPDPILAKCLNGRFCPVQLIGSMQYKQLLTIHLLRPSLASLKLHHIGTYRPIHRSTSAMAGISKACCSLVYPRQPLNIFFFFNADGSCCAASHPSSPRATKPRENIRPSMV